MEHSQKNSIFGPPSYQLQSIPMNERNPWGFPGRNNMHHASTDASLFSTSLPVLPHGKFKFNESEHSRQSLNDGFSSLGNARLENQTDEGFETTVLGSFLPDDEEDLFAGIVDNLDIRLPTQLDELEDDFFGSGGGLEIDYESQDTLAHVMSRLSTSDGNNGSSVLNFGLVNGTGGVSGEHPYGEHPSRTLFVRNINSNVEDSELKSMFEQYGDIRTLYTACKHRGFVMISYYDIRAARTAMRGLQNKLLRKRRLDIHFSIPKDNPSEKDINQGTLVVFNLDASVSNDDLRQIFGTYGEVKEIRETPHKRHHKFIEFYDVRAAEAALKALNRCDIAGKRIKLEPSRPGGARRSLIQQLTQDPELDEVRPFRHQAGSPIGNSPPGNWTNFGSPVEHHNTLHGSYSQSAIMGSLSPVGSNHLSSGLASLLPTRVSNPLKISPIGKDPSRVSQGASYQQQYSLPDLKLSSSPYGDSNPSSVGTLSHPQFLWGSPTIHSEHLSSSPWSSSLKGHQLTSNGRGTGFPYANHHGSFLDSHHVGSAPSGVQFERHFGFLPESPETSYMNRAAFGSANFGRNGNLGVAYAGNFMDSGSSSTSRMMSSVPRNAPAYFGNGSLGNDGIGIGMDRGRSRRVAESGSQVDNRKFEIDLSKIVNGEETKTTLMIKNIPNKYTSKMLMLAIDETHKGTYDFIYLPIDFKNKCNVGYAFINMVSPSHIVSFYKEFNGKKWEKFNSEKVAYLAFARIQGKSALVTHFQNSSLINEDKCCRPIVFHTEGQGTTDLPFPTGNLNIFIRQPDGSYIGDSLDSPNADSDD